MDFFLKAMFFTVLLLIHYVLSSQKEGVPRCGDSRDFHSGYGMAVLDSGYREHKGSIADYGHRLVLSDGRVDGGTRGVQKKPGKRIGTPANLGFQVNSCSLKNRST